MSFNIEKRDKIVKVLERAWLTSLKTDSNRIMVADLITKELFGDKEGYLDNTAYGDNPITPTELIVQSKSKEPKSVTQSTELKPDIDISVEKKSLSTKVSSKIKRKTKPKRKKNSFSGEVKDVSRPQK